MFTLEQGVACKVFTLNRSFLIPNINHHHLYAVYIISWGSTYHEYCVTNISCFLYNDQRRWEWFWIMLLMLCNSLLIVSWSCFVVLLWYHHHFITAQRVFPEYWDYLLLMLCCAVVRRSIDWWLVVMNWSEECGSSQFWQHFTSVSSQVTSTSPAWENITIYLQWVWE